MSDPYWMFHGAWALVTMGVIVLLCCLIGEVLWRLGGRR